MIVSTPLTPSSSSSTLISTPPISNESDAVTDERMEVETKIQQLNKLILQSSYNRTLLANNADVTAKDAVTANISENSNITTITGSNTNNQNSVLSRAANFDTVNSGSRSNLIANSVRAGSKIPGPKRVPVCKELEF